MAKNKKNTIWFVLAGIAVVIAGFFMFKNKNTKKSGVAAATQYGVDNLPPTGLKKSTLDSIGAGTLAQSVNVVDMYKEKIDQYASQPPKSFTHEAQVWDSLRAEWNADNRLTSSQKKQLYNALETIYQSKKDALHKGGVWKKIGGILVDSQKRVIEGGVKLAKILLPI